MTAKKPTIGDAQVSPLLDSTPQFLGDDIADNTGTTTGLVIGSSLTSTINHTGDLDYVRVSLVAGQTYTFSLASNGLADPFLDLANASGMVVASNDDGGITYDSFLMFTATTSGDYYLIARGYDNAYTGGYTLSAEAIDTGNTSPTSFSPNGLPFFSWEEAAVQITRTGASWANAFGAPAIVTYAFRATSTGMPSEVSGFSQFNAVQIAATEAALAAWAAVANITFVRVGGSGYSNSATMLFGNYSSGLDEAAAFAYMPSTGETSSGSAQGDVWVNVSLNYNANPVAGDPALGYGAQVLLHEIGHALGLSHPGDYNAGDGVPIVYPDSVDYHGDSRMFTTMSYFGSSNTDGDLPFSAYIPQLHDIAAIQRLYGANITTRGGDTVYGFNSNTGVPAYSISLASQAVVFVVWDGSGNDTLDFSGYSTSNVIDLRQEGFSSVGPGGSGRADYNIAIARGAVIENAIGGGGDDTIYGNQANNLIDGGEGIDELFGGAGADTLDGNIGADTMDGGDGDDTYYTDNAGDIVFEESALGGVDRVFSTLSRTLEANVENLTLTGAAVNGGGNSLNNIITGNAQNNLLWGLAGNDSLDGGDGVDVMDGGDGDDSYFVDTGGETVYEGSALGGTDSVFASTYFVLPTNVENLTLTGTTSNGGGNSLNNVITGNAQNNLIWGLAGADTLDGGAGVDAMDGGDGDDTYYVDTGGETVWESSALGGTDSVFASTYFALPTNVENLTLTGTTPNGGGNSLNNIITGNAQNNLIWGLVGNDTLDGAAGADIMDGGDGDDTFIVDSGGDFCYEASALGGLDIVISSVNRADLETNVEDLTLTGSAVSGGGNALDNIVTGNANANLIWGRAGADTLDGGAGADTMDGGDGDDVYIVDHAGDFAYEASALGGTDTVRASVSHTLEANVENLTLTGAAAINAAGNGLANTLTGNSASNVLTGGAGDDIFVFASPLGGGNIDSISDFDAASELIRLDRSVFTAINAGTLSASAFVIGAAAADADDRIIYNSTTGALFYDADGNGAGAAVQFATLAPSLALENDNFFGV